MKPGKDQTDPLLVVRLNTSVAAFGEISLKSTMPKALDHGRNVTCIVTRVKRSFLAAERARSTRRITPALNRVVTPPLCRPFERHMQAGSRGEDDQHFEAEPLPFASGQI